MIVKTHVASPKTLAVMANVVHWKKLLVAMTKFTAVLETWFATPAMPALPIASYQTKMTQLLSTDMVQNLSKSIFIQTRTMILYLLRNIYYSFSAHMPRQRKKKNVELYQSIIMFNIIAYSSRAKGLL